MIGLLSRITRVVSNTALAFVFYSQAHGAEIAPNRQIDRIALVFHLSTGTTTTVRTNKKLYIRHNT